MVYALLVHGVLLFCCVSEGLVCSDVHVVVVGVGHHEAYEE